MADEIDQFSNEELLNSALSDDPASAHEAEVEPKGDERQRDEQGRFAVKSEEPAEPEPKVETQPKAVELPKEVETVGMRQLREAFERQSRRSAELEQQLLALKPKTEPAQRPDLFEKPDEFVRANVQEALSPIEQQLAKTTEHWSRMFAVKEHGEQRVSEAYGALDKAANSGDPQAIAAVQAIKRSTDPFGEIVKWYSGNEAAINPQAFFQRQLEEALKDEKFKGELMQKLQPAAQVETKPKPVFNFPPSLNRAAAAAPVLDDGGDFSNESLLASAMR